MTNKLVEVYVEVLEERVEVYRPVQAKRLAGDVFQIESAKTDPDEVWRFPPGATVRCRRTKFADGKVGLLAVELVTELR